MKEELKKDLAVVFVVTFLCLILPMTIVLPRILERKQYLQELKEAKLIERKQAHSVPSPDVSVMFQQPYDPISDPSSMKSNSKNQFYFDDRTFAEEIRGDVRHFLRLSSLCQCFRGNHLPGFLTPKQISSLVQIMKKVIRFYIYPLPPPLSASHSLSLSLRGFLPRALSHSLLLESLFVDLMSQSQYTTSSPHDATDFFIPLSVSLFSSLFRTSSPDQHMDRHLRSIFTAASFAEVISNLTIYFPHLNATNGKRHLWISASGVGKDDAIWAGWKFNAHSSAAVTHASVNDPHRILQPHLEREKMKRLFMDKLAEEGRERERPKVEVIPKTTLDDERVVDDEDVKRRPSLFDLSYRETERRSVLSQQRSLARKQTFSIHKNDHSKSVPSASPMEESATPELDWDTISMKREFPYMFNPHVDISIPCNTQRSSFFSALRKTRLSPHSMRWSADSSNELKMRSVTERPNFAFFIGDLQSSWAKMRHQMAESFNVVTDPYYIRSSHVSREEYESFMANSSFCLCPRGNQIFSSRIFEAIWHGCIPVIFSDTYNLPFSCFFAWSSFSVVISESSAHLTAQTLQQISPQKQMEMRQNLYVIREYFSYFSPQADSETAFDLVLLEYWLKQAIC